MAWLRQVQGERPGGAEPRLVAFGPGLAKKPIGLSPALLGAWGGAYLRKGWSRSGKAEGEGPGVTGERAGPWSDRKW